VEVLILEQVNLDKDCKGSEIVFATLETYKVSNFKDSNSNQTSEIGVIARGTHSLRPKGEVIG
jgi:hypothetical protein